jgi:hypothetical protein
MRLSFEVLAAAVCLIDVSAQSAAGLRWTVPSGWKSEAAQPMRAATYSVTPVTGDKAAAECGVYFFGTGQGGSVQDNLERWKNQVHGPDGKPAAAQTARRTVRGLTITTLDTAGEYSGMGGPMAAQRAVPGYRLLGAIVEGPGGNVFVKFAGPMKTVDANRQKFEQLLASFQPEK